MCLLSRTVLQVVQIGSFWLKIEAFYRPEWTKGRHHMRINFKYLQIKNWMLQTLRMEKVDEEKRNHLSSFHVPFLSYGP